MRRAFRAPGAVAVLLLAACPPGSAAAHSWVEARSANFTVVSDAGAREAVRVATRFEQIRDVFHGLWPRARLGTGEPTLILAARDEASLRELLPEFFARKGGTRVSGVFF